MNTAGIKSILTRIRFNQKGWVFLICFFIATVFWVFTSLSRSFESDVSIPISYKNLPFATFPNNDLPHNIEFHFKGSGFQLARFFMRNIPDSIVIDLSTTYGYPSSMLLTTLALREQLPGELKPVRVMPEIIKTSFRPRLSKKVPVILEQRFEFSSRFALVTEPVIRPDSIEVTGPPETLEKIKTLHTRILFLSDLRKPQFGSVLIDTSRVKGLTLSQGYVFYYLPIEEYTEGLVEIPVELPLSQRGRITLLPEKVQIRYQAPLNRFPQIRPSDFRVSTIVPFPDMPAALALQLTSMPYGIREVSLNPPSVDYLVHQ